MAHTKETKETYFKLIISSSLFSIRTGRIEAGIVDPVAQGEISLPPALVEKDPVQAPGAQRSLSERNIIEANRL